MKETIKKKGSTKKSPRKGPGASGPLGTDQPEPTQLMRHMRLGGPFAPGSAVTNATPISRVISVGQVARFRVRLSSTGPGTLAVTFLTPDGNDTDYVIGNPAPVAVVGGTPNKIDVDTHYGEGLARVTFTPSANGTINFCDISGV